MCKKKEGSAQLKMKEKNYLNRRERREEKTKGKPLLKKTTNIEGINKIERKRGNR